MALDPGKKKIWIVSGSPAEVELELNLLLDYYTTINWSYLVCKDAVVVTVACLSNEVLERAQRAAMIAAGRPPGRGM